MGHTAPYSLSFSINTSILWILLYGKEHRYKIHVHFNDYIIPCIDLTGSILQSPIDVSMVWFPFSVMTIINFYELVNFWWTWLLISVKSILRMLNYTKKLISKNAVTI